MHIHIKFNKIDMKAGIPSQKSKDSKKRDAFVKLSRSPILFKVFEFEWQQEGTIICKITRYEDTQGADMERRVSASAEILNSYNIHRCSSTFLTQWEGGRGCAHRLPSSTQSFSNILKHVPSLTSIFSSERQMLLLAEKVIFIS